VPIGGSEFFYFDPALRTIPRNTQQWLPRRAQVNRQLPIT